MSKALGIACFVTIQAVLDGTLAANPWRSSIGEKRTSQRPTYLQNNYRIPNWRYDRRVRGCRVDSWSKMRDDDRLWQRTESRSHVASLCCQYTKYKIYQSEWDANLTWIWKFRPRIGRSSGNESRGTVFWVRYNLLLIISFCEFGRM